MIENFNINYPKDFPKELLNKSIPLMEVLGVNDVAWEYPLVLTVIKELENSNTIILGGDVLTNTLEYSGDNWNFTEEELKYKPHECYSKTIEYIQNFMKKNGGFFYFVLII